MALEDSLEREIKLAVPVGVIGAGFLTFLVALHQFGTVPRFC